MSPSLDGLLESTVLGSFTNLGYRLRSRDWSDELPAMDGETVLVTGGSSGIGLAAARRMKELGARVIVVGRNPDKLDAAVAALEDIPRGEVDAIQADLSTIAGVRGLAERVLDEEPALSIIVNGASVLPPEHTVNSDGIELTVATNLVGPFLLTGLLLPRLAENVPGRIITVSSGGMYTQPLAVDDLEMPADDFNGSTAYARTKRAQVVLTELWAELLEGTGIVAHSTHPGWVDTPGLADSLPGFHTVMGPLLRSPEQGADTIVYLAAADEPLQTTGGFWHDRRLRPIHRLRRTAERPGERERLWDYLVDGSGWEPPLGGPAAETA
jgi:dehydrogenase/reductase SDR family protein 12